VNPDLGRFAVATLAIACVAAGPPAAPEAPPWRWWTNPGIAAEIALTPGQADAIGWAHAESRLQRGENGRLLREQRVRLGELLSQPRLDTAELARVLGRISRLQRAQLRTVVHLRMRVRRILTAEQLARLLHLHPTLMHRPWEGPPGARGAAASE
jgi:Spy/CpxP family protein refolding chaperone